MAASGFKGFGWFLAGVIVAPGCYLMTSQVAAERSRLAQVESAIFKARQDIRGLETEFETRANVAQLQRWNESLYLSSPRPQQFATETQLASLQLVEENGQQYAAVMPMGAPMPVPQPAVATQPAAPAAAPVSTPTPVSRPTGPAGYAQRDGLGAVRGQAVAMLDNKLLSPSTMADLQARAQSELMALR